MESEAAQKLRILFLEDEPKDFALVKRQLEKDKVPCDLVRITSYRQFLKEIASPPDIILSDHHLPEFDGLAALDLAKTRCPKVPFIFVTGAVQDQKTESAISRGAAGVVLKSDLATALTPAIRRVQQQPADRPKPQDSAWYQQALERLPCAVLICREGQIIFANKAAAWLATAANPDALIGRSLTDFLPSQTADRATDEKRAPGASPSFEGSFRALDGETFDVLVGVEPGPDHSTLITLINVSAQKHAYAEAHRAKSELTAKLRAATTEKENAVHELELFSYSVSHDLRAPLRHIDGFAGLLRQTAGENLDASSREYLDIVTNAAAELSKLVEALLGFSRLGRTPLAMGKVDLKALAESVVRDQEPVLRNQNRQVNWQIGLLPETAADPDLLRQAFANLIANAVKFTAPRADAQIEIGSTDQPTEMIVFVRDNGVGFDMEFAEKLFGVFQKLHPAQEFPGTGIGLANVRRIIQRHGGRTWAEATRNQGATFYFSLPKSAPQSSA